MEFCVEKKRRKILLFLIHTLASFELTVLPQVIAPTHDGCVTVCVCVCSHPCENVCVIVCVVVMMGSVRYPGKWGKVSGGGGGIGRGQREDREEAGKIRWEGQAINRIWRGRL